MKFNVKWIGQGGFVLTLGDRKVCIDPYLSNSVKSGNDFDRIVPVPVEPQNLQVDMILCTHDHIDHVDEETLKYTNHENIRYAGPESCVEHLEQ